MRHKVGEQSWVDVAIALSATLTVALATLAGPLAVLFAIAACSSAVLLLRYPQLRLLWFIVGALLVFQSSDNVNAPKLVYLAGVAAMGCVSLTKVLTSGESWLAFFKPVLVCDAGLLLVLLISLPIALSGTSFSSWLRDVSPYILLAVGPFVALDAAHVMVSRHVEVLLMLSGLAASIGFASDWLNRRGVSALPVGRLLLATLTLAAAGFACCLVRIATGPRRLIWGTVGFLIPALVLITGTRTIVAFCAAFPAMVGRKSRSGLSPIRLGIILSIAAGGLYILTPILAAKLLSQDSFLETRFDAALRIIQEGAETDQSFQARKLAYSEVWFLVKSNPWLGVGPGNLHLQISLDTPLVTVADFGLIGAFVIVCFLVSLFLVVRRIRSVAGRTPAHKTLVVYGALLLALLPFGVGLEDKGFSVGAAIVQCLIACSVREKSYAVQRPSPRRPVHQRPGSPAISIPPALNVEADVQISAKKANLHG